MKLYKFKALKNIEHIFDIIQNDKLYCSPYEKLNDPFEGLFLVTSFVTFPTPFPVKFTSDGSISDLSVQESYPKICSLSANKNDVRLWSYYADGHKGVAIEIDFSGIKSNLCRVKYSEELPFFGNTLLTRPSPNEVLSCKTKHWEHEEEWRLIQKEDYFSVKGRIKAIYTGWRISDFHKRILKKITPRKIPIYATQINTKKIIVEAVKKKK